MSFSGGVGDIIAGSELAWKIYTFGFKTENAASKYKLTWHCASLWFVSDIVLIDPRSLGEQYNKFRSDIDGLRQSLVKLNEALQNCRRGFLDNADWESNIFGAFLLTLQECDAFLQENQKLRSRSNVIQNLGWYVVPA